VVARSVCWRTMSIGLLPHLVVRSASAAWVWRPDSWWPSPASCLLEDGRSITV
jgi:hypothetical protein